MRFLRKQCKPALTKAATQYREHAPIGPARIARHRSNRAERGHSARLRDAPALLHRFGGLSNRLWRGFGGQFFEIEIVQTLRAPSGFAG